MNNRGPEPQIVTSASPGEADTEESGLMDIDPMDFPHSNSLTGVLGIDNDALDFMDENILQGILPDSPPDSGSEHCQLSPNYLNSPQDDLTSINLYNDPVLYQDHQDRVYNIPDISSVNYDEPLQIVESAQVMSYPSPELVDHHQPIRNQIIRHQAAPATVIGVNNDGVRNVVYREISSPSNIKQEPCASPPAKEVVKPEVKRRKKRGASENIDTLCESSVKIKSEPASSESEQILHFTPFQPSQWRETFNSDFHNLKTPVLKVSADKGFNFSQGDDAFIAQKKNHFQLSCQIQSEGEHVWVGSEAGSKKIEYFQLNFYGVKKEAPDQRIQIEQSQTDRSRKKFFPSKVTFKGDQAIRVTEGRLHFSETTLNNMRKKGKPNPEQKYFQLVVSLEAVITVNNLRQEVPVCSLATERIIVRASNPGLFEPEQEVSWSKNPQSDTVYHLGKVGIGTENSKEALTVQGNIQVAGNILSPSDVRLKQNINRVDTKKQLENLKKIDIVEFNYRQEYLATFPEQDRPVMKDKQIGVIAQNVGDVIPDAIESAGDVTLNNGKQVPNMLIVNKDRLFLENIGAVRELSKVTDNLGHRIDELETHTVRMSSISKFGSVKSGSTASEYKSSSRNHRKREGSIFRNRWIQGSILCLVAVMTICLLAMAILYILDYQRRLDEDDDNNIPIIPDIPTNISIPSQPPLLVTTRSTIRIMTTTRRISRVTTVVPIVTTSRSMYTSSSTSPTHVNPTKKNKPVPIGKPHDCSAPDVSRECDSFCCSPQFSVTGSDDAYDPIDNNISAPGGDSMNYSSHVSGDEGHVSTPARVQDEVSNVLDVTGPRHSSTSEHSLQTDDLNLIDHSNLEEDEEEPDITAVRRAVSDDLTDNADNLVGGAQIDKTFNFVADQRVEAGQVHLKKNEIPGRLPRNQRNFDEAAENKSGEEYENKNDISSDDANLDEDEDEEGFNSTDISSDEENRSSPLQGKKSVNLISSSNELKTVRRKKQDEDSPNIIEDSINSFGHKKLTDVVENLRRKRNVEVGGGKVAPVCHQPMISLVTRAGVYNLTEEYCTDCDSEQGNCSYSVPVSRYMPDPSFTIIFSSPVTQCEVNTPPTLCSRLNDVESTLTSSSSDQDQHQVIVEANKVSFHRFRTARTSESVTSVDNICQETRSVKFNEFNIKFYRDCNG